MNRNQRIIASLNRRSPRHFALMAFGWLLVLAVLFGACRMVFSETLPDAPKPQTDKTEWSLLAVDAGVRALDVYSTRLMLANGHREIILPGAIANHTSTMVIYSSGAVAFDWWIARRLERSHRPRLAHIVIILDLGQDGALAIRNLFLPGRGLVTMRHR